MAGPVITNGLKGMAHMSGKGENHLRASLDHPTVILVSPATRLTAGVTLLCAGAGLAVEILAAEFLANSITAGLWILVVASGVLSVQAARARIVCSVDGLRWRSVYGKSSFIEWVRVDRFVYAGFRDGLQVQLVSGNRMQIQEYAAWRRHAEMAARRLNQYKQDLPSPSP